MEKAMDRIEEFTEGGNCFLYFDLSDLHTTAEHLELIEAAKPLVAAHPKMSLRTITNVSNVKFDTRIKNTLAEWMKHNKPYVKCGAICGVDGIKKIVIKSLLAASGRDNMICVSTKEQALARLLEQK
jgi:hypothetical protein